METEDINAEDMGEIGNFILPSAVTDIITEKSICRKSVCNETTESSMSHDNYVYSYQVSECNTCTEVSRIPEH